MLGEDEETPLAGAEDRLEPLAALEVAIMPALTAPPCLVSFSGGRDSSAVLAVAARAARREGLPLPVPVTLRARDAPEMAEPARQELVVRHLGLADWERLEVEDELDFVGPVSGRLLRGHGLLFPSSMSLLALLLERTPAGSLLTGVGGDSIFDAWRLGGLADVLAGQAPPDRETLLAIGYATAPRRVRSAVLRRRAPTRPWLRPDAQRAVTAAWAASEATEPVRWDRQLAWRTRLRRMTALQWTSETLAASAGRTLGHPLLDPRFVAALARAGGRRGLGSRASLMRALFADVLPGDVLSRQDKARPVNVFFRAPSRQLAARWSGAGVSHELVDAETLRQEWLRPAPDPHTALLLQSAWLADTATRDAKPRSTESTPS